MYAKEPRIGDQKNKPKKRRFYKSPKYLILFPPKLL